MNAASRITEAKSIIESIVEGARSLPARVALEALDAMGDALNRNDLAAASRRAREAADATARMRRRDPAVEVADLIDEIGAELYYAARR